MRAAPFFRSKKWKIRRNNPLINNRTANPLRTRDGSPSDATNDVQVPKAPAIFLRADRRLQGLQTIVTVLSLRRSDAKDYRMTER